MFWSIIAIPFLCHMYIISVTHFKLKKSQIIMPSYSVLKLRSNVNLSDILLWDYLKRGSGFHKYCGSDKIARRDGSLQPVRTKWKVVYSETATEFCKAILGFQNDKMDEEIGYLLLIYEKFS